MFPTERRRPLRAAAVKARRRVKMKQEQQRRLQRKRRRPPDPDSDSDYRPTERKTASDGEDPTLGGFIVPEEDPQQALRDLMADNEVRAAPEDPLIEAISSEAPGHLQEVLQQLHSSWVGCTRLRAPVAWQDILGLTAIKQALKRDVLAPLLEPDRFRGLARAPRGLMFHGPPGGGKTMMARALASALDGSGTFMHVTSGQALSKWHGDGEKFVEALFWYAERVAPCVLFLDEAEAIFPRSVDSGDPAMRLCVSNAFKAQMDGFAGTAAARGVVVVLATNSPDLVDEAICSRMELKMEFPPPDCAAILGALLDRQCKLNGLLPPPSGQLRDQDLMRKAFGDLSQANDVRRIEARVGSLLRANILAQRTSFDLCILQERNARAEARPVARALAGHAPAQRAEVGFPHALEDDPK